MQHASTNLQTRAARPDAGSAWLGVVAVSLVDVQIALRTREGCQRGQAGR